MDERPRFDLVAAAFWLVAGVMGVYALVLLFGVVVCAVGHLWLGQTCEGSKLTELLATLLATAVAFAGGLMHNKGDGK